jgi:phytanoyl-CoA hydroxylase
MQSYSPPQNVSLGNQTNSTHEYFLQSASETGYFFEPGAFDDQGKLVKPKLQAVCKLGHAMHDVDPVFKEWTRSEKVADVLRSLGYRRPMPVQSLYHMKAPGIGSEVPLHQDGTYLASIPQSVVGLWLALEDATKENGCMYILPGSHKRGIRRRFEHVDGRMVYVGEELPREWQEDKSSFVPVEVNSGTLVVLHAAVAHFSYPNKSDRSRHAWVVHFIESVSGYLWSDKNWLQRKPSLPFIPLYDDDQQDAILAGQ